MRKTNKRSPDYKTKSELKKEKKELRRKSQMEKKLLVGVYDCLRKGGRDNNVLNNAVLIGTYYTNPEYSLYQFKHENYCGLAHNGNHSIFIEVYEVNEKTLEEIDSYYDYDDFVPNNSFSHSISDFNLYDRVTHKSPYGDIELYLMNDCSNGELIINGDWIDHINTLIINK